MLIPLGLESLYFDCFELGFFQISRILEVITVSLELDFHLFLSLITKLTNKHKAVSEGSVTINNYYLKSGRLVAEYAKELK